MGAVDAKWGQMSHFLWSSVKKRKHGASRRPGNGACPYSIVVREPASGLSNNYLKKSRTHFTVINYDNQALIRVYGTRSHCTLIPQILNKEHFSYKL